MELTELKDLIVKSYSGSPDDLGKVLESFDNDISVYPFNKYEHMICSLINSGGLTYSSYLELRNEYIRRNPNLRIFEISAPRGFGEKFAQKFILDKCNKLTKPSTDMDISYKGQYDYWLDGIRIEVKASRAVDSESEEPLYVKALSLKTNKKFVMNFQQLKPQYCDVFVWVAVFRDDIIIWVMASTEVSRNKFYSQGQHRGNSGNEGQLHMKHDNIHDFDMFKLKNSDLEDAIRAAAKRNASYTP